jgi:hypothetical protein
MELNKVLLERLDKRDTVIHELAETLNTQKAIAAAGEDRQEERDRKRDEQVMQILQEIREAKHLAGKSVWSRLFGK